MSTTIGRTFRAAWRKPILSLFVALAALLGSGVLVPANSAAAAGATVTVVGSTTTIRPNSPLPALTKTASISAAQNEFESFQIVVRAGDTAINGLAARAGDLIGPNGAVIPARNITLYREAFYNVVTPSRNGQTGAWPDALIPDVDPYYGEKRNAFRNLDLAPGQTAVIWVDVLVPSPEPAGRYSGKIMLSGAGFADSVDISLRVLSFALPSTPTLASAFLIQDHSSLCLAHTGDRACGGDLSRQWGLHALYARAALENRFSISNPWYLGQGGAPTSAAQAAAFDRYILPLIRGTSPQDPAGLWKPVRLAGARLTPLSLYSYRDWHCLAACLQQWKSFAEQRGFASRMFVYSCDEPNTDQAYWNSCTAHAAQARQAWPGVPTLMTAAIQQAQQYGDTSKIDILVPLVNFMHSKALFAGVPAGYHRPSYNTFLANDAVAPANRLWMYTSCMSYGCDPGANNDPNGTFTGWPGYAIDAVASEARAMGWLSFTHQTSGELYYEVAQNLQGAWAGKLFESGANGDGTLFYPGTPAIVGGTQHIPVETLRMKRIRDGREDFEYLNILARQGKGAEALRIARGLFPTLYDTAKTEADVNRAREQLINLLDATPPPTTTGLTVTTTDAPDPVVIGQSYSYTIQVGNSGAPVHNVTLTDTLPNGVINNTMGTSERGTCTRSGQVVTCPIGTLNTGASVTITIREVKAPSTIPAGGTITNLAEARVDGVVRATDRETTTVQAATTAPVNDNFAAALALESTRLTKTAQTLNATTQAGEPMPCRDIANTVWYRFTSATHVSVNVDTLGSNFDTVLAIYTGPAIDRLTNWHCSTTAQSTIRLDAWPGTTYYIQVGGANGQRGDLRLNLQPLP